MSYKREELFTLLVLGLTPVLVESVLLIRLALCAVCCVCLRLVYPILPVSLDCPFLIAHSVFSNVYFQIVIIFYQHPNVSANLHLQEINYQFLSYLTSIICL